MNSNRRKTKSLSSDYYLAPENLETIISVITTTLGIATVTIKAISLWVEREKSKKIKIRYRDSEIEISGNMSKEKVEETIEIFSSFQKEKVEAEKVEIITLPNKH